MPQSIATTRLEMAQRASLSLLVAPDSVCKQLMRGLEHELRNYIEGVVTGGGLPTECEAVCKALGMDYTNEVARAMRLLGGKPHENYEEGRVK